MNKSISHSTNKPAPDDYSDIINLPRHVSKTHPQMPKNVRAAQFAPYAALVGHRDIIADEERTASTKDNIDREIATELDLDIVDDLETFEDPEFTDLDFNQENPLDS